MRKFEQDHIVEAVAFYKKRPSIQTVSRFLGCSGDCVKRILRENGVDIIKIDKQFGIGNSRYKINDNYFEVINSHEKAYFLGYLWADGHNEIAKDGKRQVSIQLQHRDVKILEYFKKLIYPDNDKPLYYSSHRGGYKKSKLSIRNKKVSEDLSKLGMDRNKTYESHMPLIDSEFINSFILGYFDGDGCISLQKKGNCLSANVDFISNIDIMCEFIEYFNKLGIKFKKKQSPNPRYIHIYICSYSSILNFYNIIYKNQKIFLERKHSKFIEFFSSRKN